MSLVMPTIVLLWYGSVSVVKLTAPGGEPPFSAFHIFCIAAALLGGVLPIVLTLSLKIHTERYMLKRIICCVFFYAFRNLMAGDPTFIFVFELLIAALIIVFETAKIQDGNTTGGERAVMMLSAPVFYWLIEIVWRFVEYQLEA